MILRGKTRTALERVGRRSCMLLSNLPGCNSDETHSRIPDGGRKYFTTVNVDDGE